MRDVERFDATLEGVKIGRLEESQPVLSGVRAAQDSRIAIFVLYLVHHGDAVGPDVNPMRPLSDRGRVEVDALAQTRRSRGAKPAIIWHSGKLRATSDRRSLSGGAAIRSRPFAAVRGLQPTDPTGWIAGRDCRRDPQHHARRALSASSAPAWRLLTGDRRSPTRELPAQRDVW